MWKTKNRKIPVKIKAFSLIEALIAIVVIAVAGIALMSMITNSVRQAKIAELKGIMNNEAIGGSQAVRNIRDLNWDNVSNLSGNGHVLNIDGQTFTNQNCPVNADGYPTGSGCTDHTGPNELFTRTVDIISNDGTTIKYKVNVMCRHKATSGHGCDNEIFPTLSIIGFITSIQ